MKPKIYICLPACFFLAWAVLVRTTQSGAKGPFVHRPSAFPSTSEHSPKVEAGASPEESRTRAVNAFVRMPLTFEANRGQTDPRVKFLARGQGYTLFLTRRGEAVLALRKTAPKCDLRQRGINRLPTRELEAPTPMAVVRMSLVGASKPPQVEGLKELPGKANYFIGNDAKKWRTNVPLVAQVKYHDIYPGVDLVYYGNQRQLEDDFIVAPGADPHSIKLHFTGVEKLSLDGQGGLVLGVKGGEVRFGKPCIYQEVDGARLKIQGSYLLKSAKEVSFK